jgi:hypothetical protein
MASGNNKSQSSNWFWGALFLILMTLKLTGYINWPWWIVTAPIWWGVAFLAACLVFAGAFSIAVSAFVAFVKWRRR